MVQYRDCDRLLSTQFIMTAALLAGTGLAYYWGYRGVDRRHSADSECYDYLWEIVLTTSFPSLEILAPPRMMKVY
ncbi:hypothetical protein EDB19DRAFT_1693816 [Suillus lakei]|nr:hypothetical protein EDB19DRAFT_1693816 [Suillus lakei]